EHGSDHDLPDHVPEHPAAGQHVVHQLRDAAHHGALLLRHHGGSRRHRHLHFQWIAARVDHGRSWRLSAPWTDGGHGDLEQHHQPVGRGLARFHGGRRNPFRHLRVLRAPMGTDPPSERVTATLVPTAADIIEPIASLTAGRFIEGLVVQLTAALGMSHAFVAERDRGNPDLARALAVSHDGGTLSDLVYPLPGSPCGDVLADSECVLRCGVLKAYPRDVPLAEMGIDGYVGIL